MLSGIDSLIYVSYIKSVIKIYDIFIKERTNIEEINNVDKTIIANVSKETKENIAKNEQLKHNDLIDNIFNINFMDKTSLKDLRKILYIYQTSTGSKQDKKNENLSIFQVMEPISPKIKKKKR